MELSSAAQAVLLQLKRGGVWDGDLISKEGRSELVKSGLAMRQNRFDDNGPFHGAMINELTPEGVTLAARMVDVASYVRN